MFMNGVFVVYFCLIGMDCVIKIYMLGICEYSAFEVECTLVQHLFFEKEKAFMQFFRCYFLVRNVVSPC